eukprot:augustus_masked-scaffold_8-processed-gene-9.19-mRNA-1 protein AED:1.00 eAED:1.00 QI:0/0/0/0/1/1/7/0/774
MKKMLQELNEDHMKILTTLTLTLVNQTPEIEELGDFSVEVIEKFLYQYEHLSDQQKAVIKLKQRIYFKIHEAMEALGKTVSNESIIKYLKEKLKKNKIREDLTIGEMIKKYVEFREDIEPGEVVELVFIKVSKLVTELPSSVKIKPKQIAKAIFSILPNYIWVRHKDLETRNCLESKVRKNLKKYILSRIPPKHVIARAKEMNNNNFAGIEEDRNDASIIIDLTEAMNRTQISMDGVKHSEDTRIAQLNEIKEGEDYERDHIQHANELFGDDIMMNCLAEKNTVAGFQYEVHEWDDIIIGNGVLRYRCLDPISALRSKMQASRVEVKVMKWSCPLVGWFLKDLASVKKTTAMYEEDVNWYREVEEWKGERVLKLGKLEVERDDDDVEYILPPEEEFGQMVRAISWPAKLCSDEPVNFSPEDEEGDFDTDGKIDVGANLEVSREEDKKTITAKLLTMMRYFDLKVFNNSEVWRTRFTSLFVRYSCSFGDGESPTVLSNLPQFYAMLWRKGSKKFRLVADFRPLNKITKKVSNSLPKIKVQLLRARKMSFFSSFDLLSGFDYFPCTMETGRLFTLTTSMHQIYDVLLKAETWPRNYMQWIDDTVFMVRSLEELFTILEKYLRRIEELNLRLNVDKCHLVGSFATFCGRKVDGSGYQYDRSYKIFTSNFGTLKVSGTYLLRCNASDFCWSLILAQTEEKANVKNPCASNFRIISMTSGTFRGSSLERYISSKELFAVVAAPKNFPYYLLYNFREAILFTDHRNLVEILSPKQVRTKA